MSKPKVMIADVGNFAHIDIAQRISDMSTLTLVRHPAAMLGAMYDMWERDERKPAKEAPTKPCLNCEKPHTHNNSFCSPECCKEWRAKK